MPRTGPNRRPASSRLPGAIVAGLVLAVGAPAAAARHEPYVFLRSDMAYDTNVNNAGGGSFVARITPGVGYRLSTRRLALRLGYTFAYYLRTAEAAGRDTFNHRAAAGLEWMAARRLTLRLDDGFTRTGDPAFFSRTGVAVPRGGLFDNSLAGGLTARLTRRWTLDADAAWRHTEFDDPALGAGDHVEGSLRAGWRVLRTLTVSAEGRAQRVMGRSDNDATTAGGGLGLRWDPLERLSLSGEGGLVRFLPDAAEDAWTWRASGRVRWEAGRSWRLVLGYRRDLAGATGASRTLWFEDGSRAVIAEPLRGLTVRARTNLFRNGLAPDGESAVRGWAAGGAVDYEVRRGILIGAFGSFRMQNAPGLEGFSDLRRGVVGLRVAAVFGLRPAAVEDLE